MQNLSVNLNEILNECRWSVSVELNRFRQKASYKISTILPDQHMLFNIKGRICSALQIFKLINVWILGVWVIKVAILEFGDKT